MQKYTYTAFENFKKLISGDLEKVLLLVKKRLNTNPTARILIFSDTTGKQMDFDLSGTESDIIERHKIYTTRSIETQSTTQPTVGRPKLGVIPREISLLPSHWEWLHNQNGGASSTIRQLIDEKVKSVSIEKLKRKQSQEITYKFLSSIAGDLPHYEDSLRYLYRSDLKKFKEQISSWPKDISEHALHLSAAAFE